MNNGPIWQGDMDPTLSQILQHLVNADNDRARLSAQNQMLSGELEKLTTQNKELLERIEAIMTPKAVAETP